jgi:ATPase subunit of ABC transporter with duplicated ATPase domains
MPGPSESSPHPIVLAEAVSWRTPTGQSVLDGVTLGCGREKTGLVGANGSGKTTLARLLVGDLTPTAGAVRRSGTVAFLPQNFAPMADQAVAAVLGVEAKLAALARLTAGDGGPDDLAVLDDDWTIEERIAATFDRLGLVHITLDREVGTLSGGEATRVVLASLFLRQPDLLILDEPTNNLDGDARQALYAAVRDWPGGLLVVSHDRALLGLMDRIVELSPLGPRVYGGNYELYVEQRDAEAAAARHDLDEAAKQVRRNKREAQAARERQERRSSHGKKERAKGGTPKILLNALRNASERSTARLDGVHEAKVGAAREHLAAARARVAERAELDIDLAPVDLPAGKTVLELEDVSFQFPGADRPLIDGFNLRLVGPERVALVGPNGSGKSTLLRLALGDLQPTAGRLRLGVDRVACLDQRAELLDEGRSVLDNCRARNPGLSETVCRLTLARFLFRTEDVHHLAGTLSGGERLRAALACVLTAVDPPQLLVLDEPTNHLDLASLANLEQALRQYTGALLVVSHDRAFLENVGVSRTVDLAPRSA